MDDTTIRQTALAEVSGMKSRTSQWREEEEIPEQHWMYKIAKRLVASKVNDTGEGGG